MKIKSIVTLLILTSFLSVGYCIDLNVSGGQAQSHQNNVDGFKNTFTFSVGADYYKKQKLFLRSNMTFQQYIFESEQEYDSKYLALNSLICFPLLDDKKASLILGIGVQTSLLLASSAGQSVEDISQNPINFGGYAQMGAYYKFAKFHIGFIMDACYYFGGVGNIESEILPGVASAQYLSLVIPFGPKI